MCSGSVPLSQVAAVAALLEGVRSHEDSGSFHVQLFDETLSSLCCQAASAEALSFFIGKFLGFPDVR